jgi:hypothetical protein
MSIKRAEIREILGDKTMREITLKQPQVTLPLRLLV